MKLYFHIKWIFIFAIFQPPQSYCLPFLFSKIRIIQRSFNYLRSSSSILLKNTSKLEWPFDDFHEDFTLKVGVLLKSYEGSFQKFHLIFILLQNSSKSFLNTGSLIFHWICTNPLRWIFGDRNLWTAPAQNENPCLCSLEMEDTRILTDKLFKSVHIVQYI